MPLAPVSDDHTPAPSGPRRHWVLLGGMVACVLLMHGFVTYEVAQEMQDVAPGKLSIKRMQATYVSEVKLSAPPVAAAAVKPVAPPAPAPIAKPAKKPRKPAKAASEPQDKASEPEIKQAEQAASEAASAVAQAKPPAQPTSSASTPDAAAAMAAQAAASAPVKQGPIFVWPKATRVNYKLEGNYRGPFYGTASVEWVRQDNHYQVSLTAGVPIWGSMTMTSDGEIVPQGLSPRRYESLNRLLFKTSKPNIMSFEDNEVVLANGERVKRLPDMQDPVSQLIQLAYKFITNPGLLKPGNTIEMPMVWTKRFEMIAFDVIDEEVLKTPLGDIPTFHVKPRRMVQDKDNLSGEIWFAPSLQYLPIRIFTRWPDNVYLDMQMDGAPQQTPGDAPDGTAPQNPAQPSQSASAP
ncbi:MAG: DUF3108 domain-containing protein [Aquabacterium sp.]